MHRDIASPAQPLCAWPAPYAFGNERLWLDTLIEREILRLRARYALSLDEMRGLYVSDRQVDALLREGMSSSDAHEHGRIDAIDPVASLTRGAAQWHAHFAADAPLARLGARLALTGNDLDLIFVALAPELDLRYEALYAYLNNDVGRKSATIDLARRLLSDDDTFECSAAVRACAQGLLDAGLLEIPESEAGRSALNQRLSVAEPIRRFLLGIAPCGEPGALRLEIMTGTATTADAAEAAKSVADIDGNARRAARQQLGQLMVCRGDDGERQRRWVTQWLAHRGLNALHAGRSQLGTAYPALFAVLADAALVVDDRADGPCEPAHAEAQADALRAWLARGCTVIWLVPCRWEPPQAWATLPVDTTDLPHAATAERAGRWARALHESRLPLGGAMPGERARAAAALAERFARRFSFGGETIARVIRMAEATLDAHASGDDAPTADQALEHSARRSAAQPLVQVAQHVKTSHDWSQLVLPAATERLLHEAACAISHREQVFREWNMQGRTGRGAGLMLLFAGASGTGKTMAASVLANDAGLDLFRIDLAGVVSKYIGETEKNLDRIFRAAREADAIVLFDEADALLGKRSEVKDAHDRYANLEVAYLLQKMEEHDGVVILASNLPKNLDQAFSRRMHYVVEFARPNAMLRETLWRGIFPKEVPQAGDIDYAFLAETFDLTGGDIQTMALEAAFLAAGEGCAVGMTHLMRVVARRQTKHGDPGVAARFRSHQQTVANTEGDTQEQAAIRRNSTTRHAKG